jgi:hypothetical protein
MSSRTQDMLLQQNAGQKDVTEPLFAAWRSVFFGPAKKATGAAGGSSGGGGATGGPGEPLPGLPHQSHHHHLTVTGPVSAWAQATEVNLGDAGIFTDGLFENFFEVPLPDATMSKTAALLDTFSDCANLQHTAVMQSQYQLLRYARALPISLAAMYRQVVHHGRKAVRFPVTAIEMAQTLKKRHVLLQALWAGMQFQARPSSIQALAVDCVSYILRICSPPLDVVSGQVQHVSPQERATLMALVDLWDVLGLSLKRAAADGGTAGAGPAGGGGGGFVLDPPVDDLVYFTPDGRGDKAVNPLLRLGPAAKTVLAAQLAQRHELDGADGEGFTRHSRAKTAEEQARERESVSVSGGGAGGADAATPYVPSDRWKVCLEDPSKAAALALADKRKLDAATAAAWGHEAGGGGTVGGIPGGAFLRGAGAANSKRRRTGRIENKSAVVFKFKAGFTNAVRRPVMIADLL